MIQYLKGQGISLSKNAQNRWILILEVNQIGYEIQVPQGFAPHFQPAATEPLQIFTHLQIREEQPFLYGFPTQPERDLFIQLISVSGIGSQLAIALIDTLGLSGLVQAVVMGNVTQLAKTPGVGKKTAERIALELKSKLSQWRQGLGLDVDTSLPQGTILEDVEMTLLALGYTQMEINQAIAFLGQDPILQNNLQAEEWIRQAITWLSSQ